MTMTRPVQNRERTCSNEDGPPQYIPPTLRSEYWTPWRSQLNQTSTSKDWRDPPPHRDLSESPPKCSDSPNWCVPSPSCLVSFKNPSPPSQSPPQSPTPSVSPLHPSSAIQMPSQQHTQSQLTSELIRIIKTTSEALQSIATIGGSTWVVCIVHHFTSGCGGCGGRCWLWWKMLVVGIFGASHAGVA